MIPVHDSDLPVKKTHHEDVTLNFGLEANNVTVSFHWQPILNDTVFDLFTEWADSKNTPTLHFNILGIYAITISNLN